MVKTCKNIRPFLRQPAPPPAPAELDEPSTSRNQDGLLYTTIAFTREQQQKSAKIPPKRESTEYVGIDFTRQAPEQHNG